MSRAASASAAADLGGGPGAMSEQTPAEAGAAGAREDACRDYQSSLEDLTFNSKPHINMLTILAEENLPFAKEIVSLIEAQTAKVFIHPAASYSSNTPLILVSASSQVSLPSEGGSAYLLLSNPHPQTPSDSGWVSGPGFRAWASLRGGSGEAKGWSPTSAHQLPYLGHRIVYPDSSTLA